MKLVWVSDIHLNFLKEDARRAFYHDINSKSSSEDSVIITGDISESHLIVDTIKEMKQAVSIPMYFVLGNHDFYGSDVASVRRSVKSLGWLGGKQIVELSASTALVGVDAWADCRNGNYGSSNLIMSDWMHIEDLRKGYGQGRAALRESIQKLADADARKLKRNVTKAIKSGYKKIIIATHVPPFEEVCLNAGKKSTADGLPFFSSQILGTTILPTAKRNLQVDFLWLSGHTHSRAKYKLCNNMECKVAKAEYYFPQIESIIDIK